jgi:hypothetical protein
MMKSKSTDKHGEAATDGSCDCCHRLHDRTSLGLSNLENLHLDAVRFYCTSIATNDVRAMDAAHELAIGRLGAVDGSRYVARITRLMVAIRRERQGHFGFLPACSAVVCDDELDMLSLLRACRFTSRRITQSRADQLLRGGDASGVITAALDLVQTGPSLRDLPVAHVSGVTTIDLDHPRVLH